MFKGTFYSGNTIRYMLLTDLSPWNAFKMSDYGRMVTAKCALSKETFNRPKIGQTTTASEGILAAFGPIEARFYEIIID